MKKIPGTLPLAILCVLAPHGSSTADDAVTVEAPPIKWQVSKDDGSGFIDALWFDDNEDGNFEGDEQIVSGSAARPRLVVRLAVPPVGIDLPDLQVADASVASAGLIAVPLPPVDVSGHLYAPGYADRINFRNRTSCPAPSQSRHQLAHQPFMGTPSATTAPTMFREPSLG